ncbi:MAG TPA: hypothetical protein VMC85_10980 [Desulfomonilaceae bacterium]|nr:hypothetical protein [Desulfomonilaceae bacterium]
MKGFACLSLAILITIATFAPSYSWDFSMRGEAEWRYRYWTRTGNDDIFGTMDSQSVNLGLNHLLTFPTTGTTNVGSSTFGVIAGENRYGADMSLLDYRMTIYPTIKINPAIEVTASVNLTSLGIYSAGNPYMPFQPTTITVPAGGGTFAVGGGAPGYVNSLYVPIGDRTAAVDIPNTYVTLQWLKTAIKTPMLDFNIGYNDSTVGMGLWKHRYVRATAAFSISATYGPFQITFIPYFARDRSTWALNSSIKSRNESALSIERRDDRRNYFQALEGEIDYTNGPLFVQIVSDSYRQPLSQSTNPRGATLTAPTFPTNDVIRYRIASVVKYFNGRFFFNAEADWFNTWNTGRGTASGNLPTSLVNENTDANAWLYGVETGCVCGPAKLTANYVRATGDDPSTRFTTEDAAAAEQAISSAYMKDWGYLMYWLYGTGTCWDADGYGQPTNFHHVGIKFDYEVAANLNIWGLFSNAWRDQPNAYRLGGDYVSGIQAFTNDDILTAQTGGFAGHAVPNDKRYIGWEIDLGVNWKLLENLTLNTTLAFWQPGPWWGAAFPDTAFLYRVLGGAALPTTAAANNAIGEARATPNINRNISPLGAVETSLLINF